MVDRTFGEAFDNDFELEFLNQKLQIKTRFYDFQMKFQIYFFLVQVTGVILQLGYNDAGGSIRQ